MLFGTSVTSVLSSVKRALIAVLASGVVACAAETTDETLGSVRAAQGSSYNGAAPSNSQRCRNDSDCPGGQYCADEDDRDEDGDHQGDDHGGDDDGVCRPKSVDDGNPCTTDNLDAQGNPRHVPVPAGANCSDGNACNGAETCDANAHCVAGPLPVLDDGNPCTTDACSPSKGVTHTPAKRGTSCSNGNVCDGSETCDSNAKCLPGTALVVDDGNPCTTDACDPTKGVTHAPSAAGTSCANTNPCDGNETCDGKTHCLAGAPLDIDDKNLCTKDSCSPSTGVTHTPVAAGTSCADADLCNGDEKCSADGKCVTSTPSTVDDGNPCTIDACSTSGGTTHTPAPAGTSCDNGNVCDGVSTCNATAQCVPGAVPVLEDGNPCTLDQCNPTSGITHQPVPAGTACSDGNACNGAETCNAAGQCQSGVAPVVDDANACTDDHCDATLGVVHAPRPIGAPCGDGNACNGDEACDGGGRCLTGVLPIISDANPCTEDGCDSHIGVTHVPLPAGSECGDGNACNGDETCDGSGACSAGVVPQVDDHNPCTVDSCLADGGLQHKPAPAGTACGDVDPCNGSEVCDGEGTCVSAAPTALDDGNPCTSDACSAAGVEHQPLPAGTSCSNDNPCDGIETCDATGTCQSGGTTTLDDGNPCTIDRCDAELGVVHEPAPEGTSCANSNPCDGNEACDGTGHCGGGSAPALDDHNPCTADSCTAIGGVVHAPVPAGTSCADADHCNGEEICSSDGHCVATAPSAADDGNPCTVDACSPEAGTTHTPVAAGTSCDDGNPCNGTSTCDGSGACVAGAGPSIDDGNPCTFDSCSTGFGVTHEPLIGASCGDGNACNGEETCSPLGHCEAGAPPAVDDGNPCTADVCDPLLAVQHQPLGEGASCSDGDACNGSETCNGAGGCLRAAPASLDDGNPCTVDSCSGSVGVQHLPVAAGTACGDGDPCNGDERCNASGSCLAGTPPLIDDSNPCTLDACDPVSGARHDNAPAGTLCPDTNACNGVEHCDGNGACLPNVGPQLLSVESPAPGTVTQAATITVSGHVTTTTPTLVTVSPSGVSVSVAGGPEPTPFSITVPLVEGNNPLVVSINDESACTASAELPVTRDSLPPVVTLTLPESLTLETPVLATVSATDAHAIVEVRLRVSLHDAVVFDQAYVAPPFEFTFSAPSGALAGDTLTVEAQVTDAAGNHGSASKALVISADGLVAGRVLSDATGQPLAGASVRVGEQTLTARSDGRYALPATDEAAVVRAWLRGYTTVDRRTPVSFGTGSIAVDARLTPLAEPILVSGDDITFQIDLASWQGQPVLASVTAPVAAFDGPVAIHLTPLSPQGLPGLLPLGWSPVAAFETRLAPADTSSPETNPEAAFPPLNTPLSLGLEGLPRGALAFVTYDRAAHTWRGAAPLAPAGGHATTTLPALGAYALLVADGSGAPSSASPGAALAGLPAVDVPLGLTAQGTGFPDSLPAAGGLSQGRIVVPGAGSLPSGTLIGATVSETYPLESSLIASVAPSLQDLVLYRQPIPTVPGLGTGLTSALGATFPIAPSYSFEPAELGQGKIHVEILGGREAHRGKIGGRAGAEVEQSGVTLTVVANSLPVDTLLDVERTSVDGFVPRTAGLTPRAELALDFAGATLNTSAELDIATLELELGETPLLARLERVEGVAYPHLVALGVTDGGGWTFATGDGFAGIVNDGTYVVYGTTLPLGFISGTARAASAPVTALVTVAGLPFVAPAALDGTFKIPALPGTAALSATVPGTNLAAHATVTTSQANTSAQDLDLIGAVNTVAVSPSDGAVSVERTTQVTLTSPVALDAMTVTADTVKLFAGNPTDGAIVATRLQLSANGKTLAVIPQTRLEPATTYVLQASGLRDKLGGVVVVPITTFKTAAEVPPVVNTDPVTVSLPGDGGNATVTVPAGTLQPGTTVIITNEGNGVVTSCTVGNNGGVNCEIPATADDTLVISVTDPEGNTTTFRRGQYQLPDGRTAVGPGGGVVTGPDGVEIRIPEGAMHSGAMFRIAPVDPATMPEKPYLPSGQVGGAMKVEIEGDPMLAKEVDLAFPVPSGAPAGAYYYIYHRLDGPVDEPLVGGAAFEVIDHAFVEGTGEAARVVTASCPFPGATDFAERVGLAAGIALLGLNPAGAATPAKLFSAFGKLVVDKVNARTRLALSGQKRGPSGNLLSNSIYVLGMTYDALRPDEPAVGLVRGRVFRTDPGAGSANEPHYTPLPGVTVFGCDASGQPFPPLPMTVAKTLGDGSFTLWDQYPTNGSIIICADLAGGPASATGSLCPTLSDQSTTVRCVTPVQNVVATCADNVKFYRNQVKADITFPALSEAESTLPPIQIGVMRNAGGDRQATAGITVIGDPLVLGFRAGSYIVNQVEVSHAGLSSSIHPYDDPLFGTSIGWNQIADFIPGEAGTYTLKATAVPVPPGPSISAQFTFSVVAPGGDVTSPVKGPPAVLDGRSMPKMGAQGVSTEVSPQVTFSEPVKNLTVPNNVTLVEVLHDANPLIGDHDGPPLDVTLVGVRSDGTPVTLKSTETLVTSVTVQPKLQLKFGTQYKLSIGGSVSDDDEHLQSGPLPNNTLSPAYVSTFTTVVPSLVGSTTETFSTAGVATVGDHAFVVENNYTTGILRTYDLTDASAPEELPSAQRQILGRPMDIDAQDDGHGGANVTIVTGPANVSLPSNLRIYHVYPDAQGQWRGDWIAGATLSSTAVEGIVRRVATKGDFSYALTTGKGLQIIDQVIAKQLFDEHGGDSSRIRVPFNTDGEGFGQEAVVATIPMPTGLGHTPFMSDMKVVDNSDGFALPLIALTGEFPLLLYDPLTAELLAQSADHPIGGPGFRGRFVELIHREDGDFAYIAGDQNGQWKLAVVEVTDPRHPTVPVDSHNEILGVVGIQAATDISLKDKLVLVGGDAQTQLVNAQDAKAPFIAGKIDAIGGRVTANSAGFIVGSASSTSGGDVPLGGIRVATLGLLASLRTVDLPLARKTTDGGITTFEGVGYTRLAMAAFAPADVTEGKIVLLKQDDPDSRNDLSSQSMRVAATALAASPQSNNLLDDLNTVEFCDGTVDLFSIIASRQIPSPDTTASVVVHTPQGDERWSLQVDTKGNLIFPPGFFKVEKGKRIVASFRFAKDGTEIESARKVIALRDLQVHEKIKDEVSSDPVKLPFKVDPNEWRTLVAVTQPSVDEDQIHWSYESPTTSWSVDGSEFHTQFRGPNGQTTVDNTQNVVVSVTDKDGIHLSATVPIRVRLPSGTPWAQRIRGFPLTPCTVNSTAADGCLNHLGSSFGDNVRQFVEAIGAGGSPHPIGDGSYPEVSYTWSGGRTAKVVTSSTCRSPQKSYLFHYGWQVAKDGAGCGCTLKDGACKPDRADACVPDAAGNCTKDGCTKVWKSSLPTGEDPIHIPPFLEEPLPLKEEMGCDVTPDEELDIAWVHLTHDGKFDEQKTLEGAKAMLFDKEYGFDLVETSSLAPPHAKNPFSVGPPTDSHVAGSAVDMNISWTPLSTAQVPQELRIPKPKNACCETTVPTPVASSSQAFGQALKLVGCAYGLSWAGFESTDYPHWNDRDFIDKCPSTTVVWTPKAGCNVSQAVCDEVDWEKPQ